MNQPPPPQAQWPAGPPPTPAPQRFPGGRLPDLGQAFNEVMQSFMREIGPYAMAGLGFTLIIFPIAMVLMVVIYAGIAAVVFGLIAAGEMQGGGDGLLGLGVGIGAGVLVLVGVLLMNALIAPFFASTLRAVARHQRGEQQLAFNAAFSTARQDLSLVIGVMVLIGLISAVAVVFCYFPVLIVAFLLLLALPLAALHRLPARAALKASSALARGALGWHLKFFAIVMLMNMIGGNVPVLGPMFAIAFTVRVYRELVGDGEQPVLTART